MSSEKISLQPLGYEEEEEEEKSELGGLQEKLQEDSDCKKAGNQAHRTKTKCRNIFITVTSLFGFAFVNAAVSVILPFYPIEVSLSYWGKPHPSQGVACETRAYSGDRRLVSEPDPRKIEKEGLVNGAGWKCTLWNVSLAWPDPMRD